MMYGVECPECGSIQSGVTKAGFDTSGNRIRLRKCRDCDHTFPTVEAPADFSFTRADVTYPDRHKKRGGMNAAPYWSRDVLTVSVTITPGKRSPRCRKGLHKMDEANTALTRDGRRICRECRRIANRLWRQRNPHSRRKAA